MRYAATWMVALLAVGVAATPVVGQDSLRIYITKEEAPLREKPTFSAGVIRQVSGGPYTVLNEFDSYYRIQAGGAEGWVSRTHTHTSDLAALQESALQQRTFERQQLHLYTADDRWVRVNEGNVRAGPSTSSERIEQLWKGDVVFVQEEEGAWVRVGYFMPAGRDLGAVTEIPRYYDRLERAASGWMHKSLLSRDSVKPLTYEEREELEQAGAANAVADRRRSFVNEHPGLQGRFAQAILAGEVEIGMTEAMVRASWGRPSDINRTVTATMTREQWVYDGGRFGSDTYLYFRNGRLTTYQD